MRTQLGKTDHLAPRFGSSSGRGSVSKIMSESGQLAGSLEEGKGEFEEVMMKERKKKEDRNGSEKRV